MGDSFLLTIRRHQVLPKTNVVLHQAPWYRYKGKMKGKNSKRLCMYQKNSHSLRNECLGDGWGESPGLSDFLDPSISKVQGPLSTVMNFWIPSLKNDLGDVSAMQHGGSRSLRYLQNGKQQSHARGWLLLSQLWSGQRWANEVAITVLTAWHFPAVNPCICMVQPLEHTGTHGPSGLEVQAWQQSLPKLPLSKAIEPKGGT